MKKLFLSILSITIFSLGVNSQNVNTFNVNQEFGGMSLANYAAIQTNVGSNLRLTGDWTLEAWVNISYSTGQTHVIESYSTGNTGGFVLRVANNKIEAHQIENQSTNISTVTGVTTIPTFEWHHIAATLNETTNELKVFLNGVLDGTSTTLINTQNNNNNLYIGAKGDDQYVNGIVDIDNVRIWNFAKTEIQIQADTLACLTGNETGLLAWYDFENIPFLTDQSPNGNNGSYINVPSFGNRTYFCNFPTSILAHNEQNLSIYPNPTNSKLALNITEKVKSINIIDLTGKTVKTITPSNNTLDVSDLVQGIYFLQVQTESRITYNKFIKE